MPPVRRDSRSADYDLTASLADIRQRPIMRLVDLFLEDALRTGGSVYRLTILGGQGKVSLRDQDSWRDIMSMPTEPLRRMIGRLKAVAGLLPAQTPPCLGRIVIHAAGTRTLLTITTSLEPDGTESAAAVFAAVPLQDDASKAAT